MRWPVTLALVSAATMTYGYLAALVQTNLVRLIAYSSVAQSGYFLLGVVALGVSPFAVPGLLVFAGAYVAMNLGAFAVIMVAGRELSDLEGLGRARPQLAVAMVIFLLSLTGIPPLFGFVGKFYLFTAALDAGFLWVAVIAILNSVLSLGVYLRMVVPMFRKAEGARTAVPVSSPLVVVLAVTVAVTLSFGVLAGFVPS